MLLMSNIPSEKDSSQTNAMCFPSCADSVVLSKKPDGNQPSVNLADILWDATSIDALFYPAAAIAAVIWVFLVSLVYLLTPRDQWMVLEPEERGAAGLACVVMLVSVVVLLLPFAFKARRKPSGIVVAAVTINIFAMFTNGIMAFYPTVVLVDPVTKARVFLLRWCEWTPLGALMTFMSEAVDIEKDPRGMNGALMSTLWQTVSIFCGLLLPMCQDFNSWLVVFIFAFITFLTIFPRVIKKRKAFLAVKRGDSFLEKEYQERVRFAYYLILACAIVWSVLVVLYLLNMWIHVGSPGGYKLQNKSLAMVVDTFFDVLAKSIYTRMIVDVHEAVFDTEGRTRRQLAELRKLMSLMWGSSSDAIVISVHSGTTVTAMFSPSFSLLVGSLLPPTVKKNSSAALLFSVTQGPNPTMNSYFVETEDLPIEDESSYTILKHVDDDSRLLAEAQKLVAATWNMILPEKGSSSLLEHPIIRCSGEVNQCEIKVSYHSANARVVVIRDVSERYRRLEAERKAHAEALARQKEAQAVNRFTRHEVKNGLLEGIELCDNLRNALEDLISSKSRYTGKSSPKMLTGDGNAAEQSNDRNDQDANQISSLTRRFIDELDHNLHEVLDTVLAEAMARDVIHGDYLPRLERTDIFRLLKNDGLGLGISERFPIILPAEGMPYLSLDPELLRHIHRNAISNACKYGKENGIVTTIVSFDYSNSELQMLVVNEPGVMHHKLVELGEKARAAVFQQGCRLHPADDAGGRRLSSGDGAWIMQKCAETLGGRCDIVFKETETVFSFFCPAQALKVSEWNDTEDFEVPANTWGIAIDDSKVQRRLLTKILAFAGVKGSRCQVLGKNYAEVLRFDTLVSDLVKENPEDKVLILVDENLDFGFQDGEHLVISGSVLMKSILDRMSEKERRRVLALVRSANDSAEEICLYTSRTHGFFPKCPMQRERVQEILAPLWADRFFSGSKTEVQSQASSVCSESFDSEDKEDILESVHSVDALLDDQNDWKVVWSALHALKGDLMVFDESDKLQEIIQSISSMRGEKAPADLSDRWQSIRAAIIELLS